VRLAAALTIAIALAPSVARADEHDDNRDANRDDKRIAFLRDALARDASASRTWFMIWVGAYTLSTAGESILAVSATDPGIVADARVGAVKSAIGWVSLVVLPPPSLRAPAFLPPRPTDEERAAFIAAEEKRLEDAADAERFAHSWLAHVGVAAVNVAGGLYLWQHDNRLTSGIITSLVGTAIGEIQIWTAPTIAIAALKDYRAMTVGFRF
jgi:hypothetical protein